MPERETKLPLRDALIQAIQKTGEVCDCGNCPEDVADAVLAVLERNKQPEESASGFTAGGYYDAPTNAICVKPCGKCCYPQDCAEAARCLKQPQQAQPEVASRMPLADAAIQICKDRQAAGEAFIESPRVLAILEAYESLQRRETQQAQDDAEGLAQFIAGWCEQHPSYEYNQLADAIVARSKA